MTSLARYSGIFICLIAGCSILVLADDVAGKAPASGGDQANALPVPSDAEQKKAKAGIEQIFKDDLAGAKTAAQRSDLAKKLLQVAIDQGTSPAECYVLLTKARDLAADAADVPTGIQIVAQLATRFQLHADALVAETLPRLIKSFPRDGDPAPVVESILGLIEKSMRDDRYEVARTLASEAGNLASRTNNPALKAQVSACAADVRRCEAAYNDSKTAQATLAKNPNDPAANLALGRYLCFSKGDWEKGLPHLANGSDAKLKALALGEKTSPDDAAKQKDLGDGWYDYAQGQSGTIKTHAMARAGDWYHKAEPNLVGLAKIAVDKRLEQIEKIASASATVATVAPKPADWTDLLKNIDPAKETVTGTWSRTAAGMTNAGSSDIEMFTLPGGIGTAYELEYSFNRNAGDNTVMFAFPAGTGRGQIFLSAWRGEAITMAISGEDLRRNRSTIHPGTIENNHLYTLHVRVVPTGDEVTVSVDLDGKPCGRFQGVQNKLAHVDHWTLPAGSVFGIGAQGSSRIVVSAARMRPIKVAIIDTTGWTDLLKTVDVSKHAIMGTWTRDTNGLATDADLPAVHSLMLPAATDGQYDLQATFSRTAGVSDIGVIFPVGTSRTSLILSGGSGAFSGLELVKGLRVNEPEPGANPTIIHGLRLANNRLYTIDLKVRLKEHDAEITVLLDGQPIVHWTGPQTALSCRGDLRLPDPHGFGITTYQSAVTFSNIKVKAVSGQLVAAKEPHKQAGACDEPAVKG